MTRPVELVESVRQTITVAAGQEQAFRVFTEKISSWWPTEYSIGLTDMADFILEPWVGGRWYEVGVDASECDTGRVTAYEPPDRLVLAWHLDANWEYDPDPDHASEVEVRFHPESETRTRVELEHRYFERHGADAATVREAVASRGGWGRCLTAYQSQVAG